MVDPVAAALVAAALIIAALCFFLVKLGPRETSFEEAYGSNARKLLNDEKNVKNAKGKSQKSKKNAKHDKRDSDVGLNKSDEEKENGDQLAKLAPSSVEDVVLTPALIQGPSDKSPGKKNKKPKKKSEVSSPQKVTNVQVDLVIPEPLSEEKVDVVMVKTEEVCPVEKVESRKPAKAKKCTTPEQVLDHIGSQTDPNNVKVLKDFIEEAKKDKKKASDAARLAKDLAAKEAEIDRLHDQIESAQTDLAKVKSLEQALADTNEKYNVFEASIRPKLVEHKRLSENVRVLQVKLAEQNSELKLLPNLKHENDDLKNSVTLLSQNLAAANARIKEADAETKKLSVTVQQSVQSDGLARELEQAKESERLHMDNVNKLQNSVLSLEAELERRNMLLKQLNEENDLSTSTLNEFRGKADAELAALTAEVAKWQSSYKSLEQRLNHFEKSETISRSLAEEVKNARDNESAALAQLNECRNQLASLQDELLSTKKVVESQRTDLEKSFGQCKELDGQAKMYESKMTSFDKVKEEYTLQVQQMQREIDALTTQNEALNAEKKVLENRVAQASGHSTSTELLQKDKEIEELKLRNQDLRDRNNKLHDTVRESEDSVKTLVTQCEAHAHEGVQSVVGMLAEALGSTPPSDLSQNSLLKWSQTVSQKMNGVVATPKPETIVKEVVKEVIKPDIEQEKQIQTLQADLEKYMTLSDNLYSRLDDLGALFEQMEKDNKKLSDLHKDSDRVPRKTSVAPSQTSEDWEVVG